jgi:hypothetical protein
MDLLRQRSDQAGELVDVAGDDRLAKGDIGEDAGEGVGWLVIGRRGEEGRDLLRPELGRGDAERLLAREMVEEGALGDIRGAAEIVDAGGGEALGADDVSRRFEQAGASIAAFGRLFGGAWHGQYIPFSWYVASGFSLAAGEVFSAH